MATPTRCPRCGEALAPQTLQGLCPRCVARMVFGAETPSRPAGDAVSAPPSVSRPQVHSFGDYELIEEIGRGGMGVVYRARQISLNRQVAVKLLLAGGLADEAFVRRFQSEAEAAAGLQHPHIVAIHEIGEHEGLHYLCMDYVAGASLAERVREGPLKPESAARYVALVARAIHHAHQCRILHRDLKPANILIDSADQPRVTDFGLAKRLDAAADELTLSGQWFGSVNYLPPEQAFPEWGPPGVGSDIYALGAVLYHLLTGQPPFAGHSVAATLVQIQTRDPVPPRQINPALPRELEAICLKCLTKRPAARYPSALALAEDVERWQTGRPTAARPTGPLLRLWQWSRRRPGVAVSLVTFVFLLATILGGVFRSPQDRRASRLPAAPRSPAPPDITRADFALLPPLPEARHRAAAAWFAGRLHVLGGEAAPCQPAADHFVFDPDTRQWTRLPDPLLIPRDDFTLVATTNGLYAVGAACCGRRQPAMERYDPAAGGWQPCAPLPKVLQHPAVAADGGHIHVLGGLDDQSQPNYDHFVYETASDTWRAGPPFPHRLNAPSSVPWTGAVVRGDTLYVLVRGGAGRSGFALYGCWLPRGTWIAHGPVPLPEPDAWQAPRLASWGSALIVVPDHVVEGRLPLLFYRPATRRWQATAQAVPGFENQQAMRVVAGPALYLLGHYRGAASADTIGRLTLPEADAPRFTVQPVGGIVNEGDPVVLRARVTGGRGLTFQWRHNGRPVPGATSAVLRLPQITRAQAGRYQLRVRSARGEADSVPARLIVTPAADGNPFPVVYLTESRDLWLCDRDGVNHVPLVLTGDCWKPVWSPDGSWILFLRGDHEVWCIRPDGAGLRGVTAANRVLGEPAWISCSRFVVCTASAEREGFLLHAGSLDTGGLKTAFAPRKGPVWGFDCDFVPACSRLFLLACETNWTPRRDVYLVDPASWEWRSVWSDDDENHEDDDACAAARSNRLAWRHALDPGVGPAHRVVAILDLDQPHPQPHWLPHPPAEFRLLDWTDQDDLLLLELADGHGKMRIIDDRGAPVRFLPTPEPVLDARWDKSAR